MNEEEAVVSTETTTSPPVAENTAVASTPSAEPAKPAGYDPIDPKTSSPEEVQQRLDYLYKQIKPTERENREMRKLLAEQSKVIDELAKGQQAVVSHLTEKSFADSEAQLKQAMQDAWKKGDERAYIEAQNKLMDVQVNKRVSAMQSQPQVQPQNQRGTSAAEIANGAMQGGVINEQEYRITETWQNERDQSGRLVRPWAFDTDPAYKSALRETAAVFDNPRYQHWSYEQKLAEVDKRMGVSRPAVSQQVMGGNLTKQGKTNKIELTPKQREIALKSKYAGKGKTEADHLEAYRKQIEKFQQKKF